MGNRGVRLVGGLWLAVVLTQAGFAQTQPVPVIKTTAQTVLIDVVVADRNGEPVTGLKKEDFTVFEDGKPEAITFFEAHTGAPVTVGGGPKLPEGMYSNFPVPLASDAVDVVLLDALNTPTADQMVVRKEMIAYLKAIPPGTRIAIFTLASQLRMVNGFTTDPTVLLNALSQKGAIDTSPLLITPGEQQQQDKLQDQLLMTGNLGDPKRGSVEQRLAVLAGIASMRRFAADQVSFDDDFRVKETLKAMDQLGRYLGSLPGRKNLIWFSASFPIGVDPDFKSQVDDVYRNLRDYSMDVRATAQRLAAARVAVYPIDARRFFQNPVLAPSNGGGSSMRNAYYHSDAVDLAFDQVMREHDTMELIADNTGGKAIYNTNDLKGAMSDVIRKGERYYTLAYDPVDVKQDGRFHKIKVKSAQPDYKLLYRHGYVAADAKESAKQKQPDKEQTTRAGAVFRAEMEPGAPPSSELLFRVQTMVEEKQPSGTDPVKGDNPKTTKPVTRYAFGYAADVGHTQLVQTEDGIRHGLLMTMVIAYDQQGRPLNSVLNTMKLDLEPKVYADALMTGLPFYQELDIPAGEATLRVGVYDVVSHKMGAVEFPLTVKAPAAMVH